VKFDVFRSLFQPDIVCDRLALSESPSTLYNLTWTSEQDFGDRSNSAH